MIAPTAIEAIGAVDCNFEKRTIRTLQPLRHSFQPGVSSFSCKLSRLRSRSASRRSIYAWLATESAQDNKNCR
jgi:hypothetical protein